MRPAGNRMRWVAAVVSVAVVMTTLSANLLVHPLLDADERLPSPPGGSLDYDAVLAGGVPPLTSTFIRSRTGLAGLDFVSARTVPTGSRAIRTGTGLAPRAERTVIDHALSNDDFGEALTISSLPFTARTDATRAEREVHEPYVCDDSSRTIWYRFRPTDDVGLFADTFGTRDRTSLGVFEGRDLGRLTRIGCHQSDRGAAHLAFAAKAGRTYHFQLAHAAGGEVVFSLDRLGQTKRASLSEAGKQLNDASGGAALSPDGRYVAFHSWAVAHRGSDTEGCTSRATSVVISTESCADVYMRDLTRGRTIHVSVADDGRGGNDVSALASVSATGRYVSFTSWATDLVDGDTNASPDAFVRDVVTGTTERVSVDARGRQGSAPRVSNEHTAGNTAFEAVVYNAALGTSISPDGRFVAFASPLNGLADADSNDLSDVFVRDRSTGRTERVSVAQSDAPTNDHSYNPAITPDGRYVAFHSYASNLVPGDTNRCNERSCLDAFVFDRKTRKTTRVSVSSSGRQGDDNTGPPTISRDGRHVAFVSNATTLVPGEGALRPVPGDVYVRDRVRGLTHRVSVSTGGDAQEGGLELFKPVPSKEPQLPIAAISADGRHVAFASRAANLGPGDDGTIVDVFVHDLRSSATVGVSMSSKGVFADDNSYNAAMSATGSRVAFSSVASNLVSDDTNACGDTQSGRSCPDVFVHDFTPTR